MDMPATEPTAAPSNRIVHWLKKEALPLAVMLGLLLAARDSLANHWHQGVLHPTTTRCPAVRCSTP